MFCEICDQIMERIFTADQILYKCYCGEINKALSSNFSVVKTSNIQSSEVTEKYVHLIRNIAYSKCVYLVDETCEECGLDYMVRTIISDDMVILTICKCGFLKRKFK